MRKHTEIQKRHKASLNMDTQSMSDVEDRTWNVTSEDGQRLYIVIEVNSECEEDCLLRCTDCDICVHSCECTCQDYLVLANTCKHKHFTVQTKKHKTVTKGRGVIDTNKTILK